MGGCLFIAWQYLIRHRLKTAVLVVAIALTVYVPVGLHVLVGQSAAELTARARSTPLIAGAKGSPLELVLNTLYFESKTPEPISHAEAAAIAETHLATPVPLYVRFNARGRPIVGTTLDYFTFRKLRVASGAQMAVLGDCVLGAEAAEALGLAPGDSLLSSPQSVFDLAGVYPLKMRVAGVLAPSHGPDDRAVFVDIKTAWIIQGLAHGHQDLSKPQASGGVLRTEGDKIIANASVRQYTEVTDANRGSFHFHGDPATFPVSAVIALPTDRKSAVLLRGRYQSGRKDRQIVVPATVMDDLLATILTVRSFVVGAMAVVGAATLAIVALVFVLSVRLRKREIQTLAKIGGASGSIAAIVASEIVLVALLGLLLAGGMTVATQWFGLSLIRTFIA